MKLSWMIARRFLSHRTQGGGEGLAVGIATWGIAIGLAIMLLSVGIGLGFKNEISTKILGFASHALLLDSRSVYSTQSTPIEPTDEMLSSLLQLPNVKHLSRYSTCVGVLKTETDFKDILLKGIGEDYDTTFLAAHIIEGRLPNYTSQEHLNDIVISHSQARQMQIAVGDRVYAYFFEGKLKTRRFNVCGIYETNFNQFDNTIVIANIHTVGRLNGWEESQCTGLEVQTHDPDQAQATAAEIIWSLATRDTDTINSLCCYTSRELYASVFEWLALLDLNLLVIIILMLIVASCTAVSGLLITILQRTPTIGILKALGSTNRLLRHIFRRYSLLILGRGLLLGNLLGLGLCLLQQKLNILGLFVHLDPQSYYIDRVPILFNLPLILLLNALTFIIASLALLPPSLIISRITAVEAIKTD